MMYLSYQNNQGDWKNLLLEVWPTVRATVTCALTSKASWSYKTEPGHYLTYKTLFLLNIIYIKI